MPEALWDDVAAAYDRSFATLCSGSAPALLTLIPAGSRVLDVGCGSGHLTAALLAAGHVVTAVDPDPEMVALASSRSGADIRQGGLPDLPFDDVSFDIVLANFVLNHVDDPRAAVRGLVRVARPGGQVAATVWPASLMHQAQLWNDLLDAAGAVRPPAPRLAPHLDFERSSEGLGSLLSEAGLDVIEASAPRWDWSVRPEDFWAGATTIGNFGVTWRAQSTAVQESMRELYEDFAAPWLVGEHLVFPVEAVLVTASA